MLESSRTHTSVCSSVRPATSTLYVETYLKPARHLAVRNPVDRMHDLTDVERDIRNMVEMRPRVQSGA